MTLRPWLGSWSTYSVLGLVGYVTGSIIVGLLGRALGLDVTARLVAVVMPALGFLAAVSGSRLVAGEERIVFYQASFAAWLSACIVAWCADMPVAAVSDLVIVLIATFLAFGRVGCLHVACCHGRPSRHGVRYTAAHAALGFPARWVGRPVFPVQLVEAAASAVLAAACTWIALDTTRGTATCVFVLGYALVRFPLELARGDSARPYYKGLSQAQWIAVLSSAAVLAYRPTWLAILATAVLLGIAVAVAAHQRSTSFKHPHHLDEVERSVARLVTRCDATTVWTSAGLKVSARRLEDGTIDLVWSHANLTRARAEQVANALFTGAEVIPGKAEGLFHVLVQRDQLRS